MYSARVHGPPRRDGRQVARARCVGGGQGDGGAYRAPAGGRFAGRAPGRPQYYYGPQDRGFGGGYETPRFPRGGGRQPRGRRDGGYCDISEFYDANQELIHVVSCLINKRKSSYAFLFGK